MTKNDFHSEITKTSIRIYGSYGRYSEPAKFDRTFSLGDHAEYDSYNLVYTGPIRNIGPKTVSMENMYGKLTRLTHEQFIDRNWDYDAETIGKRNFEELMCI